ncbi:hypothetical protein C5609_15685 [Pseudomonas putida]|uniref:hypothetical protein n=1 Tax=Pseudomonas putida TaxID=303 RepID=UPI00106FCA2B|nr:hypothetical protein [Pseudomonas putida]TFF51029.1 hypothetical protein C5609_15685 [Pseudomonas putida]
MSIIFDVYTLNQARADAEAHNVDLSRCRIAPLADGGYSVQFDTPVVNIGAYLPDCPTQHHARSAAEAEGLMLTGLTKIQRAERQAIRAGCVGRDAMRINREPITSAELDAYRARQREAELQKRIAAELVAAVEERQAEANKAAAAELAARYPGSVAEPRKASKPKPVPSLPSVAVKPSARGAK